MVERKEIEVIDYLTILADEFNKIVSLINTLKDLSKDEFSIKVIKGKIKDFAFKIEEITRVYTISEYKLLEYFKGERDSDNVNIDKLSIGTSSQPIEVNPEEISLRPQKEKNKEKIF